MVAAQDAFQIAQRQRTDLRFPLLALRPLPPVGLGIDRESGLGSGGIEVSGVRFGDPVAARLVLLRIAVAQDALEIVKQRGVEHRDLAIFEPDVVLAELQQALHFGSGKPFAAAGGEVELEVKPLLAGTENLHARGDPLDLCRDMGEARPERYVPLRGERRVAFAKEGQDGPFAPEHKMARGIRPGKPESRQFCKRHAFGIKVPA